MLNANSNLSEKEKTTNLILYIAHKMCEEKGFGATVLNKVLYYVDNLSYLERGKPISGFTYIKQDRGATPAPRLFMPLKKEMIDNELAMEIEVNHFGRIQKRLIAKVDAQLNLFSSEEIALIDRIIEEFNGTNATIVSTVNHKELAWEFASDREELPPYTYLLTKAPIEEEDIEWAHKMIDEYETLRYS